MSIELPTAKLDQLVARHAEVEALLAAGAEGEEYVRLGREFSDLSPVVEQVRALRAAERDLADARELLADPEMRDLAQSEVTRLEAELETLAKEVRLALLPKDAMDERDRKSVV